MTGMTGKPWGPDNPHPLSKLRTELVWEGKYDEFGDRRTPDAAGHAMPMQKIETVDQPRFEAAAAGQVELFDRETKRNDDFRNRLIWGDNKLVAASLLKDFGGAVDLIYLDPPFDVGADFSMNVPIGDVRESVAKDQSTLEMVAYRDMWGRGTDSYLHMMFERLAIMAELLSDRGSLFVHCDWRMSANLRCLLDSILGPSRFQNEIVWQRAAARAHVYSRFPSTHDVILFYRKSESAAWNPRYRPHSREYIDKYYRHVEEGTGRRYTLDNLINPNPNRPTLTYEWGGVTRVWRYTRERMDQLEAEGRIYHPGEGKVPRFKRYLDEMEGVPITSVWTDIPPVNSQAYEATGFDTQKPEMLLQRIVEAASDPGDLVADLFCGSGTTGVVSEQLGRRWLMADLGRFGIHTSRKRLIDKQRSLHEAGKPYRAFDVYNLGRYERQWWQKTHLNGAESEHRRVVLEFFRAEILANPTSPLLHGRKDGAFCHVDNIDSMFQRGEARAVAQAVAASGGTECYCLAWEFEMELRQAVAALERELGVKLKLIQIPREIMEKQRTSPPPFLEMAVLEVEPVYRKDGSEGSCVDVRLSRFLPSLAEVPTKELEALKERALRNGFDFIDFWAVDFAWQPGKPFAHHWQDYRTRKDRSLRLESEAGYVYDQPGRHTACVKVVDVFGCDTSVTIEVDVP